MSVVTVSPKSGQQVHMMIYRGNLVLVPLRPIEELRGFLKGIDTEIEREPDRL